MNYFADFYDVLYDQELRTGFNLDDVAYKSIITNCSYRLPILPFLSKIKVNYYIQSNNIYFLMEPEFKSNFKTTPFFIKNFSKQANSVNSNLYRKTFLYLNCEPYYFFKSQFNINNFDLSSYLSNETKFNWFDKINEKFDPTAFNIKMFFSPISKLTIMSAYSNFDYRLGLL